MTEARWVSLLGAASVLTFVSCLPNVRDRVELRIEGTVTSETQQTVLSGYKVYLMDSRPNNRPAPILPFDVYDEAVSDASGRFELTGNVFFCERVVVGNSLAKDFHLDRRFVSVQCKPDLQTIDMKVPP